MRVSTRRVIFLAVLCSLLPAVGGRAEVKIEYIAHACFVITSPGGTRVVVDPYNTNRWLGYSFPDDLEADAVLITHPHYDHDAGYYFPPEVPVFRNPGRYQVGDVRIRGVGGRHAEPYGKEFGQSNTLWVVEAGGLRIAHLGDTGPLSPASMRGLGPVDVLMIPVDSLDHILKKNEIELMRAALRPRITVPMHYRITGLTELPRSLGPIEPWLEGRRNVRRLGGNHLLLARKSLPETDQIMVFNPSPAVRRWNAALFQAWAKAGAARQLGNTAEDAKKAVEHLREATRLAPQVMVFWWGLGSALAAVGETEEAIRSLELWTGRSRARRLGIHHARPHSAGTVIRGRRKPRERRPPVPAGSQGQFPHRVARSSQGVLQENSFPQVGGPFSGGKEGIARGACQVSIRLAARAVLV